MAKLLANFGVAITRPVDQAKKLSQRIQEAGGTIISFPLIEILPLSDYSMFERVISDLTSYDWVIFISSNAVQNGMPRIVKSGVPAHIKYAAIGPVTAQELKQFGVKEVLIPDTRFDSESLLDLPEMHEIINKKIMIVRGVGGREVLAETLKKRGAEVTFAECYRRINPQTNVDLLAKAWGRNQLHAIVVTSTEAMRHLLDLAIDANWLKQVTICVNHARVAELPLQMGLNVQVAESAGDEAMFKLLCH